MLVELYSGGYCGEYSRIREINGHLILESWTLSFT